ncbi:MAG: hypothetical protein AB7T10_01525 [bacterium]
MKKSALVIILTVVSLFLFSQSFQPDLQSYMPKFYELLKDSIDFRYYKSFNVSYQGAEFSSINQVLDHCRKNKLDTISILIYGNLEAESVYIDTPFRFISICGVNSACNASLSNTVFINKADSIYLTLQNLSFKSLENTGYMAYMGFFHNMIESMRSTKDVAFSDIFASEITEDFNWPSTGYLVWTQGKGVGKNFYGIISNCYNKRGDTLIIYGNEQKRELYFADNFTFIRYLHITGYLNVQNQISIMNGRAVSVLRADETVLAGDFKTRTKTDSIYFSGSAKNSGITTPWRIEGDLTVEGEGYAKISKDGALFIREKNGDSIQFSGGRLSMSKNDIMGEGNIFMKSFLNFPGSPLLMKYNIGTNSPVRWGIADGDKISDFSIFEDSANSIIVRKSMKPDTLSMMGSISTFAGAAEWTASDVFSNGKFTSIVFSERKTFRGDSLFSWDKKTGVITVNYDGIYYAGYTASVKKIGTPDSSCKAALRLVKNKKEEEKLNSVVTLQENFEGYSTLNCAGVLSLKKGDLLSLEFYSSTGNVSLRADDIFSSKNALFFYLNQIK